MVRENHAVNADFGALPPPQACSPRQHRHLGFNRVDVIRSRRFRYVHMQSIDVINSLTLEYISYTYEDR